MEPFGRTKVGMARVFAAAAVAAFLTLCVAGCAAAAPQATPSSSVASPQSSGGYERVNADTTLLDVIDHAAFEGFGRFLFPTGRGLPAGGKTLREAADLLPYHRHVDVATTVDVVNSLMGSVERGQTVFYDIYTDEEKAADPSKEDTGLFFFKGRPAAPLAIVSAGGGFSYVGSIHESLPHALELSRKGYNGFALQYRTGGAQVACEDLAAAISFVFRNAEELGVSTDGYSLWGGSAGARMAAYLGSRGSSAFGGDDLPRPGAVIMQYTGHTDYTKQDPPTYACVGEDDGIANWRTMKRRLDALSAAGVDTEFHLYPDLGHGFGLGLGTSAEGWIDDAVAFWERHLKR
jgi:acetyl esterase/lipase